VECDFAGNEIASGKMDANMCFVKESIQLKERIYVQGKSIFFAIDCP